MRGSSLDSRLDLIKDEVNVKEVIFDDTLQADVELDTTITPELKEEGMFRELIRFVQEMRKKLGFKAGEAATLSVGAEGPSQRFMEQHEQELSRIVSLKNINIQAAVEGGELFQADELVCQLKLTKD